MCIATWTLFPFEVSGSAHRRSNICDTSLHYHFPPALLLCLPSPTSSETLSKHATLSLPQHFQGTSCLADRSSPQPAHNSAIAHEVCGHVQLSSVVVSPTPTTRLTLRTTSPDSQFYFERLATPRLVPYQNRQETLIAL